MWGAVAEVAKTIYSMFCPGVLFSGKQPGQVLSATILGTIPLAASRWRSSDTVGTAGWRGGGSPHGRVLPGAPSLGLLQLGRGRRWRSQSHLILSPLPVHVRNSPCFRGQEGLPQGRGAGRGGRWWCLGWPDAISSHPVLSASNHFLHLLAAGFEGILLQSLAGHRPHFWDAAFMGCTPSPTQACPRSSFLQAPFLPPRGWGMGLWTL